MGRNRATRGVEAHPIYAHKTTPCHPGLPFRSGPRLAAKIPTAECSPHAAHRRVRDRQRTRSGPGEVGPMFAGRSASRGSGFSSMGRCTMAANTPEEDSCPPHHVVGAGAVVEHARRGHTPRKLPIWWLRNTTPNSVAMNFSPKICATIPRGQRNRREPEQPPSRTRTGRS